MIKATLAIVIMMIMMVMILIMVITIGFEWPNCSYSVW